LLSPVALKQLPPFALFWIDEVRSELAKVCCRLEFRVSRACAAREPGPRLERLVHDAPAALWILLLCSPPVHQWFLERKLTCVVAGSCLPGVSLPSVNVDFRAACRHAVGVFRRNGHSRLALVVPAGGLAGDVDGEEGFCEAIANGPPPAILRHNGTREDILRRVTAALDSTHPPTGFLATHSAHALTVLTLLLRRGLQLPSQAAVIARDDDAFLDFVTPRVARYSSDPATYARHLSHVILEMLRSGPGPSRPVRLMPRFVPGETV
jgi:LacI family transcriptional regulator